MKNYIEMKGVKKEDLLYITPKGATVKVLSSWHDKAEVEVINPIPGGSPKGTKGNMLLSNLPGLEQQIKAAEEKKENDFLKKYPGIDELLTIIRLHSQADEAFNRMMETGDSILRDNRPEITIENAHKKYPAASAYLHIYNLFEADPSSQIGFIRRSAANEIFTEIENGLDVIAARKKLDAIIEKESNTSAYRNHIAGL